MEHNQHKTNSKFPVKKIVILSSLVVIVTAITFFTVTQIRKRNAAKEDYQKALVLMKKHNYGAAFVLLMPLAENTKDLSVKLACAEALVYSGYWPADSIMKDLAKEKFQDKSQLKKFEALKLEYAHFGIPEEVTRLLSPLEYGGLRHVQVLDSCLAQHPNSEGLWLYKGLLAAQHSNGQNEAIFKRILAINPQNLYARRELMRTYLREKNYAAMQTEAAIILKVLPEDELANVSIILAQIEQQQRDSIKAQIYPGLNGHELIAAKRG